MLKKLQNGTLVVIGYLLSPLCWWNDLIINLPIAYLFGRLFSWSSPELLLPLTMVGYWLSNIVGILMMQFGVKGFLQKEESKNNWKKELFNGLVSSTAYTLVILVLLQLNILDAPSLFSTIDNFKFLSFN